MQLHSSLLLCSINLVPSPSLLSSAAIILLFFLYTAVSSLLRPSCFLHPANFSISHSHPNSHTMQLHSSLLLVKYKSGFFTFTSCPDCHLPTFLSLLGLFFSSSTLLLAPSSLFQHFPFTQHIPTATECSCTVMYCLCNIN